MEQTGKDEQISAMASPTNQVKNDTIIQPQTRGAGPAYWRLEPYKGVIPVKSVIVENEIASVLNKVCKKSLNKRISFSVQPKSHWNFHNFPYKNSYVFHSFLKPW